MDRIKRIFVLTHILLWTLFCLLIFLQLGSSGDPFWFRTASGLILTCLYTYYSHFFILTRYHRKKRNVAYFLRLAGVIVTGPLPFLIFHYRDVSGPNSLSDLFFMTLVLVTPVFFFLSWLTRVTQNLIINTIKKEELEKKAVEAELHYLKSQINPHFLFNTLNNIHTLVYKKADTAPEAVLRLSSLMRYMIYESNTSLVPLANEIEYLKDYITLQQLRYKESPVVDLQIKGDPEVFQIAPLLFIHLLENAYKHGPARLAEKDIKVLLEVNNSGLSFKIENPVRNSPENNLERNGGIGLPNVRKRLELLYPVKHKFEISKTNKRFTVILNIHKLEKGVNERKTGLLYN